MSVAPDRSEGEQISANGPFYKIEPDLCARTEEPIAPHTSRTYQEYDGQVRFLRDDFPVADALAEELGLPAHYRFGTGKEVLQFIKGAEVFRPIYVTPEELAIMVRRHHFKHMTPDLVEWDASTGTFKLQRFP